MFAEVSVLGYQCLWYDKVLLKYFSGCPGKISTRIKEGQA